MSGRDLTALAVTLLIGAACTVTAEPTPSSMGARYVALGDSYTIGTAVSSTDAEIARFNEVLRAAAEARGIAFVPDIYEISRRATSDPLLVAGDGLHPSGAQYALWVDAIRPVVQELLAGA